MEEMGLAQQSAGQEQQAGGAEEAQLQELVMQVIQMLQQGVSPEELLQKGVPEEIIQMAMQMLQQQGGQEQGQPQVPNSPQGQGLAQMSMQQ